MRKSLLLKVLSFVVVLFVVTSCGEDVMDDATASCNDGIKNQDETGVDCGGVCSDCPEPTATKDYWVKFKVNGEWVLDERNLSSASSYSGAGVRWASTRLEFGVSRLPWGNEIESFEMLGLEGETHSFLWDSFTDPYGFFEYNKTPISSFEYGYSTVNVDQDPVIGTISITSVEAKGPLSGTQYNYYEAEGTFSCEVVSTESIEDRLQITEGSFRVYFVGD